MSESNGYATRDMLLGGAPPERRFADVLVHGKKFRLRSLTAGESNRCQAKHLAIEDEDKRAKAIASLPCRTIVQCVVNADGQRIFSDTDVVDLMDLDAAFVTALATECRKHAGIEDDDEDDAKKNSNGTVI
jgi:hypothetical protein